MWQLGEVNRHNASAGYSVEKTVRRRLQHWRMIPELGGLADRRVDHRVERDDTPDELLPHWLRLRKFRASQQQGTNKPPHKPRSRCPRSGWRAGDLCYRNRFLRARRRRRRWARQTETHSRKPKSGGGPAALDAFARWAAKVAPDATGEPCPEGPASAMERILVTLSIKASVRVTSDYGGNAFRKMISATSAFSR